MYIKEISGKQLEEVKDEFLVIDVRTKEEYQNGHVDGAINIEYDEILDNMDKIDKQKPLAVYCRTNNRSEFAALSLIGEGYQHVYLAPGVELYDYNLVK